MAESQFGTASFEFYEGVRILLPGAIVAALYASVSVTFIGKVPDLPGGATLGVISLAVLAGLVAYFVDAPSKTAAFRENVPNQLLDAWGLKAPPTIRGSLNVYFLLLDELMPQPVRARALYMGSIYRIGLELIYCLGGVSVGVLAAAAARGVARGGSAEPLPLWLVWGFASACLMVLIWTVHLQSGRHKQGGQLKKLARTVGSIFSQSTSGWLSLPVAAFIAGGGVVAVFRPNTSWLWPVAAVAGLFAVWAVRYFRGFRPRGSKSFRRLDPPAAVFLLLLPLTLAGTFLWHSHLAGDSGLAVGVLVAWASGALLTLILIASRGHEKRLGGSYATQRTWLEYNKAAVLRIYGAGGPTLLGSRVP